MRLGAPALDEVPPALGGGEDNVQAPRSPTPLRPHQDAWPLHGYPGVDWRDPGARGGRPVTSSRLGRSDGRPALR